MNYYEIDTRKDSITIGIEQVDNKNIINTDILEKNHISIIPNVFIKNSDGDKRKIIKITFKNLDDKQAKFIKDSFLTYLDNLDENYKNDWFVFLNDIFSNDSQNITQKLIGDLGEIIFILKLEKYNVLWWYLYQKTQFDRYDFSSKKYLIDVKTTTDNKSNFLIKYNQLFPASTKKQKIFFIVELIKSSGGLNIIDLLNKITNHNHNVIKRMKQYWLIKYKTGFKDVIDSWTIDDINFVKCYKFNEKYIPKINLQLEKKLIDVKFVFSTTGINKNSTIEKNLHIFKNEKER